MKLHNNLFSIVSKNEIGDGYEYTIQLNPNHFIYAAHFPEEPITPGVCIMQIAQELLENSTNKILAIQCVKNVKFLRIISPKEITTISFLLNKIILEDDIVKTQISVVANDNIYAKLSLICQIID